MGVDEAILSLPSSYPFAALKGWIVGLTWRGFETWRQARRCVCVAALHLPGDLPHSAS